jgi:phage terminase large subunit-like protein
MLVMITTAGTVRECIYDDIYDYASQVADGSITDDRFLPILYELDDRSEWTNPDAWMKANPGLGKIKKLDDLWEKVERAKKSPKDLPGILCKDFNIRETVAGSWLTFEQINNETLFDIKDLKGSYALGGCDLSAVGDLTCATLLIEKKQKLYVIQQYFIPLSVAEKKEHEDKVPYSIWRDRGLVTFTPGASIDYSYVTNWFKKMRDEFGIYPLWVGYDKWNANYWVKEMSVNQFTMDEVIQGAKTMSPAMKQMEADFADRKIIYNNNPILKWNLTNTQIKADENENIRPVKGRNAKLRIDGTVSLIDAYVIYMRHYEDYKNLT